MNPPDSAPIATLAPETTAKLLAEVDAIARRMTHTIADVGGLPPEFRSRGYLRSILRACRDALRTLVHLLTDGHGMRPGDLDRLGLMGAEQAERGVPLDILLASYRLAAKIVWREVIMEATRDADLPPATLIAVTENVLEYLDQISGAVGASYLATRERLVREQDRNRDRVVQRLLAGDVSPELRTLAAASHLDLAPPYRVIAYRIESDGVDTSHVDDIWRNAGGLAVAESQMTWVVLLPAKADRTELQEAVLRASGGDQRGIRYGIGPIANGLGEIALSAQRARSALDIGARLEPQRMVHHDAELGIFATLATDPDALARYVALVLGSLADATQPRLVELLHTLEELLNHHNLSDAAAALGLHRHTVVYRIRRLRELGIDPESPLERPRLWLALQARRLLDSAPQPSAVS